MTSASPARRRCLATIAVSLFVLSFAPAGCRRPTPPPATAEVTLSPASVEDLLASGKTADAVALARRVLEKNTADSQARHLLAVALVAEADARGVRPNDGGKGEMTNERSAKMLVEAASYDPSLPGVYTGLVKLLFPGGEPPFPPPDLPPPPARPLLHHEAVHALAASWRAGVAADPSLANDQSAVRAASILAMLGEDYVLATELSPDWLDAQMAAATDLARRGLRAEAAAFLKKAQALNGDQADVLALAAVLGEFPVRPTEQVFDVALGRIGGGSGEVIARQADVFVTVHRDGGSFDLLRIGPDGTVKTVFSGCWPSFDVSRDGRWLAFVPYAGRQAGSTISLLDLATGQVHDVDRIDAGVRGLALSPDGDLLAHASDGGLMVEKIDGSERRLVAEAKPSAGEWSKVPSFPRWSPDGQRLLYADQHYESYGPPWVYDRVTAETEQLTKLGGIYFPRWTGDGSSILIAQGDPEDLYSWRAQLLKPGEATFTPLTDGRVESRALVSSPDGRQALISMRLLRWDPHTAPECVGSEGLWIVDLATRRLSLVKPPGPDWTLYCLSAAWTEDGHIYFIVERPDGLHLIGLRPE